MEEPVARSHNGNGYGDGYGDGSGYGDGNGYGDGDPAGHIGEYPVCVVRQWRLVRVGCQVHTLDEWRTQWRTIAQTHGIRISSEEAQACLDRVSTMCEEGER